MYDFGDIAIFLILAIWLENAYSPPFWVGFWGTFPQMMSLIVLTPKGPSLGRTTSFEPLSLNIGRKVRAGRWNEKKRTVQNRTGKSHKRVIFHLFGEKPHWSDLHKNCLV